MQISDARIANVFHEAEVEGTVQILALASGQHYTYNPQRASTRFVPASSFKVINTLIALECSAISSVDETIRWDGSVNDRFPAWNTDQTLKSAFQYSCVWFYQELARRVGSDNYRQYLKTCSFGELSSNFEISTFWLDGSLTVSAQEQVNFLAGVDRRELPFSARSYDALRALMLETDSSAYALRGKTGWAMRVSPQVGWYVGSVETRVDKWIFATNLRIESEKQLPLRQLVTLRSLQAIGAISAISPAHLQLNLSLPKETK